MIEASFYLLGPFKPLLFQHTMLSIVRVIWITNQTDIPKDKGIPSLELPRALKEFLVKSSVLILLP